MFFEKVAVEVYLCLGDNEEKYIGEMSITKLAKIVNATNSYTFHIVKKCISEKLISVSKKDGRTNTLKLTLKGKDLYLRLKELSIMINDSKIKKK